MLILMHKASHALSHSTSDDYNRCTLNGHFFCFLFFAAQHVDWSVCVPCCGRHACSEQMHVRGCTRTRTNMCVGKSIGKLVHPGYKCTLERWRRVAFSCFHAITSCSVQSWGNRFGLHLLSCFHFLQWSRWMECGEVYPEGFSTGSVWHFVAAALCGNAFDTEREIQ